MAQELECSSGKGSGFNAEPIPQSNYFHLVHRFRAWGYSDGCGTQSGEVGRKFSKKHGELVGKSEISSGDEVLWIRLSWLRLLDSEK